MASGEVLSDSWSVQYLHSDGHWYEGRGGPTEDSARASARDMWARGARGVRLVRSERAVVQEKRR